MIKKPSKRKTVDLQVFRGENIVKVCDYLIKLEFHVSVFGRTHGSYKESQFNNLAQLIDLCRKVSNKMIPVAVETFNEEVRPLSSIRI